MNGFELREDHRSTIYLLARTGRGLYTLLSRQHFFSRLRHIAETHRRATMVPDHNGRNLTARETSTQVTDHTLLMTKEKVLCTTSSLPTT
jgi:hypothetical protein